MTVHRLTRDLVSIPSHEDETAAGDHLETWFRQETDAVVERDEVGNVIARRDASASAKARTDPGEGCTLAFVGHHDVVPPADSQTGPGGSPVVEERDGRLYGRGTADMNGALAAMACAFRDAEIGGANGSTDDPTTLTFASFVGEERGGVGARHAIENGFAPDHAVVGEGSTGYSAPGVTDVAVAHKGRRGSTITARGSAAHASEPEAGENAIYRAIRAVEAIRHLDPPSVEVAGETLSGTVVVTEIDGGTAMNVVPERCTITVDERTVPGDRAPLEQVGERPGVEWTVDQDLPPMACSDESFAEAVRSSMFAVQSGEPALVTKPHATDAGWLARAGTECVVCGAAEPGEAHTADESVSLAVLDRCYEGYLRLAERWSASG